MRSQMKSVQNLLLFSFVVVVVFFHFKTDLGLRTSEYIFLLFMFTSQNETQVNKGEKRNGWQMCSQTQKKFVHERSARVIDVYFSHFAIS